MLKDKQTAANDVVNGLPILYRVNFPVQNPLPKPTSIFLNNQLLCSGPEGLRHFLEPDQSLTELYLSRSSFECDIDHPGLYIFDWIG